MQRAGFLIGSASTVGNLVEGSQFPEHRLIECDIHSVIGAGERLERWQRHSCKMRLLADRALLKLGAVGPNCYMVGPSGELCIDGAIAG